MKNRFLVVHCLVSLFLGIIFYCLYDNTTVVTSAFYSMIGVENHILDINSPILYYIRLYGLDLIWAYSMWFGVALACFGFNERIIISTIITIACGTFLEILQLFNIIYGTADIFDVLSESLGVVIAILIYKKMKERIYK